MCNGGGRAGDKPARHEAGPIVGVATRGRGAGGGFKGGSRARPAGSALAALAGREARDPESRPAAQDASR